MIVPTERDLATEGNKPVTEEYIEAFNLDLQIRISGQAAQQNLYEMCMGLKTMHDKKLYKELGFSSFEKYAEERHGFSREQGRKMIRAVETYAQLNENGKSSWHFDGTEKYFLLSTLSEEDRNKIIESTDLENTTVRELKGRIKDLEQQADNAQAIADKLTKSENKAWGEVSKLQTDSEMQKDKIAQLEQQIKELENRPIEVIADDSTEVRNLKLAMRELNAKVARDELERDKEDKKFRDMFREQMQADRDAAIEDYKKDRDAELEAYKAEREAELEKIKAELAKTKADMGSASAEEDKEKQDFKALLTNAVDSIKRLTEFVSAHDKDIYKAKLSQLANLIGG